MKTLDMGCGKTKILGSIGVDLLKDPGVDVVHDLEKIPYPFKAKEFDIIYANHILEHLENLTAVMQELHRILKDDGEIRIRVPHFSNYWAFSDPTHKRFFGYFTLDYYCGLQKSYLDIFTITHRKICFGKFFKPFEWLFNKLPTLYENRFAFLVQASELIITLKKKQSHL